MTTILFQDTVHAVTLTESYGENIVLFWIKLSYSLFYILSLIFEFEVNLDMW